ncbi:MAG: helix-turn-helix domain-containing protein, partial [Burkholderiales bacterium]
MTMSTKRPKSKNYPASVIAQALALLVAGESVQAVADKLRIPHQTVSEWKAQFPAGYGYIQPKRDIIEDLMCQHLEAALRSNLAQLVVFSDPDWIRQQSAQELAILYGVTFVKAVRIFEAAARAEARQQ